MDIHANNLVSIEFETPERWVFRWGLVRWIAEGPADEVRADVERGLCEARANLERFAGKPEPDGLSDLALLGFRLEKEAARVMIDAIDAHVAAEGLTLIDPDDTDASARKLGE